MDCVCASVCPIDFSVEGWHVFFVVASWCRLLSTTLYLCRPIARLCVGVGLWRTIVIVGPTELPYVQFLYVVLCQVVVSEISVQTFVSLQILNGVCCETSIRRTTGISFCIDGSCGSVAPVDFPFLDKSHSFFVGAGGPRHLSANMPSNGCKTENGIFLTVAVDGWSSGSVHKLVGLQFHTVACCETFMQTCVTSEDGPVVVRYIDLEDNFFITYLWIVCQ